MIKTHAEYMEGEQKISKYDWNKSQLFKLLRNYTLTYN
jgi:hypothetical protein